MLLFKLTKIHFVRSGQAVSLTTTGLAIRKYARVISLHSLLDQHLDATAVKELLLIRFRSKNVIETQRRSRLSIGRFRSDRLSIRELKHCLAIVSLTFKLVQRSDSYHNFNGIIISYLGISLTSGTSKAGVVNW